MDFIVVLIDFFAYFKEFLFVGVEKYLLSLISKKYIYKEKVSSNITYNLFFIFFEMMGKSLGFSRDFSLIVN